MMFIVARATGLPRDGHCVQGEGQSEAEDGHRAGDGKAPATIGIIAGA